MNLFPISTFAIIEKNSFWLCTCFVIVEIYGKYWSWCQFITCFAFYWVSISCFHRFYPFCFYQKLLFLLTWFILSFRVWVAKSYSNPKLSSPHFSLGSPWSKYMSTKEMLRFCQNASYWRKWRNINICTSIFLKLFLYFLFLKVVCNKQFWVQLLLWLILLITLQTHSL